MEEELVLSDFLVESDLMDETTFDVCLALETKLVEELVVSDFLIDSDGMDENTLDVCSALKTMLLEERIARVGDGWIETTSSCEEWKEETVDVCKLIEFVSITVIVGFTWEVFVAGNSGETAMDEISVGVEAIGNTVDIFKVS